MIGVFLMLKIVPALQRIFEEFGVELGLTILMVKSLTLRRHGSWRWPWSP